MATKPTTQAGSSESATMASLRGHSADERADETRTAPPAGAEVVPQDLTDEGVIEGHVIASQRAAQHIVGRGYRPATAELIGYIAGRAIDTSDLNVVILEQMALRMSHAQTPAEILDPFGTVKGQALYGQPIEVLGCEFLESDVAEGFPWYVSLQVLDRTSGRTYAATVGGEKLVLQAAALDEKGMWPLIVRICEAEKPTKAGFYPLELRPAS